MRLTRFAPFGLLLAGTLVFVSAACGGGGDDNKDEPTTEPSASATSTSAPTNTATVAPPTPTATPTPYAGQVSRLKIPRFGVDAPIELLGVDASGNMETPLQENTTVGWYDHITKEYHPENPNPGYDRPGWGGNATFSAHVYYHNIPAPFVSLAQASIGDDVVVTMDNGVEYTYKVVSNERYHRDTIPMGEILWPSTKPAEKEWITLITCGGELDATGWEYISRDVIVAERVS